MPCSCDQAARRAADSRTCPTEPAGPSRPDAVSVWTESTTSNPGSRRSAAARMASSSVSASTWIREPGCPSMSPSRSARRCNWSANSSPEAYSTAVPPARVTEILCAGSACQAQHSERHPPRSRARAWTCRYPARHPAAPTLRALDPHPAHGPPRGPRRSAGQPVEQPHPAGRAGPRERRSDHQDVAPDRSAMDPARRSRPASPTCRTRGSGLPKPPRPRRRTGRRSGSPAAPRV